MARPTVFKGAEYIGAVVDGDMAREVKQIAERRKTPVSTFIREALAAAITDDLQAQLHQRLEAPRAA